MSSPRIRLLLANAYESAGDTSSARRQYVELCRGNRPEPTHLAAMVLFMLRNGTPEDARPWVEKLDDRLPESDPNRLV